MNKRLNRLKGGTIEELREALFIGVYPGGVVYADRRQELYGDYRRVAFLPYDTLEVRVADAKSPLLPLALEDARDIQSRKGEEFEIAQNRTVRLGSRCK